ncbi:MAG: putative protein N(5)-glutamine methyltransferase [Microlunatus sp.]
MDSVIDRLRQAGCVYAEDEAAVLVEAAGGDDLELERLVSVRVGGAPLEPLLGWVAFGGLRVAVGPGVFVPRVRTELLAELGLARLGSDAVAAGSVVTDAVVVELCCGVAAVAAVLQRSGRIRELYAVDIDPIAVGYARQNLSEPAVTLAGDLYEPMPARLRGRVDLILANAPYVPTDAIALMPREARDHEPLAALDGGADGADIQRRIIAAAPTWLRASGHLMIETGREQSTITATAMADAGLVTEVVIDDNREGTVVIGQQI